MKWPAQASSQPLQIHFPQVRRGNEYRLRERLHILGAYAVSKLLEQEACRRNLDDGEVGDDEVDGANCRQVISPNERYHSLWCGRGLRA